MPDTSHVEKLLPILFSENPEGISERDGQLKLMLEDIYNRCLQFPWHTNKKIVEYITQRYALARTQGYFYLNSIKPVLGNVKVSSREFQRARVIEMALEAYEMARKQKKPKEMAMAIAVLGKYTKLDKDDLESVDWETLQPPTWEPSADLSLLNIPGLPQTQKELEALKQKLRAKYLTESTIDAEILDE